MDAQGIGTCSLGERPLALVVGPRKVEARAAWRMRYAEIFGVPNDGPRFPMLCIRMPLNLLGGEVT